MKEHELDFTPGDWISHFEPGEEERRTRGTALRNWFSRITLRLIVNGATHGVHGTIQLPWLTQTNLAPAWLVYPYSGLPTPCFENESSLRVELAGRGLKTAL